MEVSGEFGLFMLLYKAQSAGQKLIKVDPRNMLITGMEQPVTPIEPKPLRHISVMPGFGDEVGSRALQDAAVLPPVGRVNMDLSVYYPEITKGLAVLVGVALRTLYPWLVEKSKDPGIKFDINTYGWAPALGFLAAIITTLFVIPTVPETTVGFIAIASYAYTVQDIFREGQKAVSEKPMDLIQKLTKIKDAKDSNLITQQDYDKKKGEVLAEFK
jgi:hypothetical protein